jgi:hypothetical protein
MSRAQRPERNPVIVQVPGLDPNRVVRRQSDSPFPACFECSHMEHRRGQYSCAVLERFSSPCWVLRLHAERLARLVLRED